MLVIPSDAIPYILFQRTGYVSYQKNRFLKKIINSVPFLTYNRMVNLESLVFKNKIKRLFSEDMQKEYESMKTYLPLRCKAVLDVGCGVGGVDILLGKHYGPNCPNIYLLDKTEINENVYYKFEKKAAYYNSLDLSKRLLIINGIPESKIHTQEADGTNIFLDIKFDLVISLISWGFHYSIDTYLDTVYNQLNAGGRLIVDVRKNTGGEELLKQKFGSIQVIVDEKNTIVFYV